MSDWKTAWGKLRQQQDKTEPQKQTVAGSQASKTVAQQDPAQLARQRVVPLSSAGQIPLNPSERSAASQNIHSSALTHLPQRIARQSVPPPSRTIQAAPQQDQVTKHSRGRIDASIASSPTVRTERRPPSP